MMNQHKILPPTYLLIALLAMIALHFLIPLIKIVPSPWNAIGVIFLLAGILLNYFGGYLFHQAGTPIKPFIGSSTLVTQGVFRFSRNPMYLGFTLILGGAAILLGTLAPFLVILVFLVLMEIIFIKVEEKMLEQKFGQLYLEYKRRVQRWL